MKHISPYDLGILGNVSSARQLHTAHEDLMRIGSLSFERQQNFYSKITSAQMAVMAAHQRALEELDIQRKWADEARMLKGMEIQRNLAHQARMLKEIETQRKWADQARMLSSPLYPFNGTNSAFQTMLDRQMRQEELLGKTVGLRGLEMTVNATHQSSIDNEVNIEDLNSEEHTEWSAPMLVTPPGSRMMGVVEFAFPRHSIELVFEPWLADYRHEHNEALKRGADEHTLHKIDRQHRWAFVRALFKEILPAIWKVILAVVLKIAG